MKGGGEGGGRSYSSGAYQASGSEALAYLWSPEPQSLLQLGC